MRSAKRLGLTALVAGAALMLAACGGGSSETVATNLSGKQGSLLFNPPVRVGSITASDFAASLQANAQVSASAKGLLTLLTQTGLRPVCGIDFHYIRYYTVGGAGEPTSATGALMVPTGAAGQCSGKRPILLYAHGTAVTRGYNLAYPNDPTNEAAGESALLAAVFAAQGYIVVAPNYAGYDLSPLPYHPWLNAGQQSQEMIDALTAARTALGNIPAADTLDGGVLVVSGYSQGGHVAMATLRAMEAKGMKVTAAAPMSGPYAIEAFSDAIVLGKVNIGSTVFLPLITESYQHAYKNVYQATTDVYSTTYATGIDSLLPGALTTGQLFAAGKLPLSALFDSTTPVTGNSTLDALLAVPSNPLFAAGFGNPFLINNTFRLGYAIDAAVTSPDGALPTPPPGAPLATNPTFPLRQDLKLNDLRNPLWVPGAPTLLCGGGQDPTVFFLNTQIMLAFWQPLNLPAGLITALDVDLATAIAQDSPPGFAPLQAGFTATFDGLVAAEGQSTAIQSYHGTVAPFCSVAARLFFKQVTHF
jgi:pimeloyl-ACP methyl ester carboxylesterase